MAMTAYTGLQGHGKSYEVVRGVILPNIAKGRRVVTNIAGLKDELIADYCVAKFGAERDQLGSLVHISNDDVVKTDFFPRENTDNSAAIVQPGDIVVLDECWRWYVTGEPLQKAHLTFFRMHRHFIHPQSGQCCDIVLIVQVFNDLQRKVKGTVEKSFLMEKHKDLGMPDRYVINIYSGSRQNRFSLVESRQEKYSPEIFALYSSYSQAQKGSAGPKEEQADNRGNVLNRKLIKFGLPIATLMVIGSTIYMWRFFHPSIKKAESIAGQATLAPAPSLSAMPLNKPSDGVSERWRLVGLIRSAHGIVFILSDATGRVRFLENPPHYKLGIDEIEVALPNGEVATRWSGAQEIRK